MEREGTRALDRYARSVFFSAILIRLARPSPSPGRQPAGERTGLPFGRALEGATRSDARASEASVRTSGRLRELGRTGATGPTLTLPRPSAAGPPTRARAHTLTAALERIDFDSLARARERGSASRAGQDRVRFG